VLSEMDKKGVINPTAEDLLRRYKTVRGMAAKIRESISAMRAVTGAAHRRGKLTVYGRLKVVL